jgi:hypothetical protein
MAARPSSIALTTVSEGDGLFPGFSQTTAFGRAL